MIPTKSRNIIYRGSLSDLATDIAFEMTATEGEVLIIEIQRLIDKHPEKFCNGKLPDDIQKD